MNVIWGTEDMATEYSNHASENNNKPFIKNMFQLCELGNIYTGLFN